MRTCGTYSAYTAGCRCDRCKAAGASYRRGQRHKEAPPAYLDEAPTPLPPVVIEHKPLPFPERAHTVALPGGEERRVTVRVYGDVYLFRCDGPSCPRLFHPTGCAHAASVGEELAAEQPALARWVRQEQVWGLPRRLQGASS